MSFATRPCWPKASLNTAYRTTSSCSWVTSTHRRTLRTWRGRSVSSPSEFPHDLVVAGRPRWKEAEDYRVIEELGIMNRIHFLHIVPNHDLPALYTQASCFVYPSLYESFGLAQLEAMACGCPVLGSNTGAIPEVAGDAALLFDPHSPEDIAGALRRILFPIRNCAGRKDSKGMCARAASARGSGRSDARSRRHFNCSRTRR